MKIFLALFFAACTVAAQTPEVPHKMQFAGMTLTIRDDARKEIQKDVNALTQSPRHHNIKVERAKTYFPVIEKVFQEENVPDDFKYLVLQESALIADAVSVSNAVGFWQFKDFTALEMGLRVDKTVDERLNIVSSSRAAARYIKKNNFFFNNWIYALQAYQMGAGGVLKTVGSDHGGLKHMEITSHTYWYVKKFLAHKVAFEDAVKSAGLIKVVAYENKSNKKTLTDIAKEVSVDENELKLYNKWAKTGSIPDDRTYIVMIPQAGDGREFVLPPSSIASSTPVSAADGPKNSTVSSASAKAGRIKINGISAIKANTGESATQLASRAAVDLSAFLKWNDLSSGDRIDADQYYLLGKKRARATASYHKVLEGENLWMISQQYGVQMRKLKKYNRMSSERDIKPGTTLWLASTKPRDSDKALASVDNIVEVDKRQTFGWAVDPEQATVSSKPVIIDSPVAIPVNATPKTQEPAVSTENIQVSSSAPAPKDTVQGQLNNTVVVPAETNVVVPVEPKREHVVQAGETVYGIARQYDLGVMDLVERNNLNLQQGIKPGQVLKLTESQRVEPISTTPARAAEIEHVVKSTDTLYSVARKYNVTIKELMEWNNKSNFGLAVGEKLKVRTK